MNDTKVSTTTKSNNLGMKMFKESIIAILSSLLIGLMLMAIIDPSVIKGFIKGIFDLSFGSLTNFSNFLANLSWMIPLGLSLAVSFRIGVFNIGSAGQMFIGGFFAYMFATSLNVGPLGWIIVLIIGMYVGMFIAVLIGILKTRYNINEVITSIMFNWMIFYFIRNIAPGLGQNWSGLFGTVIEGNSLKQDWLLNLFNTNVDESKINIGVIIAFALVPLFVYLYKKSNWGYKQDLLGGNIESSAFLGINKDAEILKTMAISGALAGLAGAIFFVGFHSSASLISVIDKSTSEIPGIFFNGITIALLGFNSATGVMFASILLSILYPAGEMSLDSVAGGYHIVDAMIGVMIVLMARANYAVYKSKKIKGGKPSKNNDNENSELSKESEEKEKVAMKKAPSNKVVK